MKHIKRFNENRDNSTNDVSIIEHYLLRQKIEVKDIIRKQGDGKEIPINGIGIIRSIKDFGDDISYEVEFDIEVEHGSPFSSKRWVENKNRFIIFHNGDKDNIVRVF